MRGAGGWLRDFCQTQNLSTKSHMHYVRGRGACLAFEPVRVCVSVCSCVGGGADGG